MQSIVVKLPAQEDAKRHRVDHFDGLYAEYLKAQACCVQPGLSDKALNEALDRRSAAVWEIIKTPTVLQYQISYKLEVLRAALQAMEGGFTDRRHRALLESICMDLGEEMP